MPGKPTEMLEKWIGEQLEILKPGERFATDRELSQKWGISQRTIVRMFKKFQKQGKVWRIPGRGTYVAREDMAPESAAGTLSSVESVADSVRRAISSGDFKRGEALPSVKFMCLKFHMSAPTVIHAYRRLHAQGLIERVGKTFWVGTLGEIVRTRPQKEVVFFQHESDDFSIPFQRDNMLAQPYQKMERELMEYGFKLTFATTDNVASVFRGWMSKGAMPHGLVFYAFDDTRLQAVAEPLRRLLKVGGAGRPSVLMEWAHGNYRKVPRGCTVVSRGNIATVVARELARYAVGKKHRSATVFFDESSPGCWDFWSLIKIRTELKALDESFTVGYALRADKQTRDAKDHIEQRFGIVSEEHARYLLGKYRGGSLEELAREMVLTVDMERAFPACAHRDLWIFPSEHHASLAVAWARKNGMSVPRDLAIVGLENNPKYYHLGISSCTFDWETTGYLMAHAIIGDFPVRKSSKGFLKTRAYVMEKATT